MIQKIKEYAGVVALVAIVLLVGLGLNSGTAPVAGGTTNYDGIGTESIAVGDGCNDSFSSCSGTTLELIKQGTCNIVSDSSIAATSTGSGTCAISGLLAGDHVMLDIATTSTALSRALVPMGVIAGTDSATIRLFNLTGAATTPGAIPGFGSSTPYSVFRAQ